MNKALTSDEIDKAIRLLEYHIRLASLRAPVVRDITRYEKVLWVKDIPMIKGCFAQAWGRNEAYDIDVWMEVQSRREPQIPHVPEICYDWINFEQLNNDNDLPELKQQIQVSFQAKKTNNFQEDIDESTVAGEQYINDDITLIETRQLVDFPEVYDSWQAYLNDHWIVWSGEHRDWKCINRIYSDLFAIHQEQLRLGEEYELVIGLGLLNWKARIGQIIRRHMVVANAMLDFDSKPGRFTIRPSVDGASLRPELDMFDLDELPNRAEDIIKSSLESAEDDPWVKEPVDAAMTAFVHSLHAQGEYRTDLGATTERVQDKPIIEFAPAIILRKRSAKGLTNTLLRIKEEIINTGVIPPEFQDLSEIGKHEHGDREHDSYIHSVGRENSFEGEVYFTKPSNTEQHRIIEKIQGSTGVLVQGPPVTGHPIWN